MSRDAEYDLSLSYQEMREWREAEAALRECLADHVPCRQAEGSGIPEPAPRAPSG